MEDTTEVERARFEWRAFRRTLAVWAIDFCCAASVVAALWYFVRYCVFDGERIPASAHEVSEIVSAISWPSALVLVLLLFRNPLLRILNELPSFVRRSFYRHGEESTALDPDEESEDLSAVSAIGKEKAQSQSVDDQTAVPSADAIGRMLVKKYGGRYFIGKCIGNRRYVFDVVIETPTHVYGVVTKRMLGRNVWSQVLHRVRYTYADFPESLKLRFVFMPVVFDITTREELEHMASCSEFKTIVEFCHYDSE